MKRIFAHFATLIGAVILLASCSSTKPNVIPLTSSVPTTSDNYTIIWLGTGTSYRFTEGAYQADPTYDYTFSVTQRRYEGIWKSIKDLHRLHPDYDGVAGPRDQTMYFEIAFEQVETVLQTRLETSLGKGSGESDLTFRNQTLEVVLDGISSMAPYNMLRITQEYKYEDGLLLETVELFKRKNGVDTPFMKIEEKAEIFRPAKLEREPMSFEG